MSHTMHLSHRHSGTPLAGATHPLVWLQHVRAQRHARAQIANLSPELLYDIGLAPGSAWSEGNRPYWELLDEKRRWNPPVRRPENSSRNVMLPSTIIRFVAGPNPAKTSLQ